MADTPAAAAHAARTRALRRASVVTLLAVIGPGLLAGLSDDDPAGITTYSVLGARFGYRLLWVLLVSTVALVLFHQLGARVGVVTGQGLAGLMRQRFGVRRSAVGLVALVVANVGTTCAEFAGIAAGMELFGVPRGVSVPIAALLVSFLVLRAGFHRIERVLLVLSAVFIAYVIAGVLAHPDWGAAFRGLVVPSLPGSRGALVITTATIGTTLAPWGLSFIQSYAVDKRLTPADLPSLRVDVITGSVLTGVIGFFVVVSCAATLHVNGLTIHDASDAARALRPLAGTFAATIFAVGLVGSALLAASILPLSTAYSVSEYVGVESALDDRFDEARVFYVTFGLVTALGVLLVLIPHAPLIPILVLTQVLNAVLLLPILVFMVVIARDPGLMGEHAASRRGAVAYWITIAFIAVAVGALGVLVVT